MSEQSRATLKAYFETGDKPTQAQFEHLIDSMTNITDDTPRSGSFSGSFSGSHSGSFHGDGSGLTGVTAEWDGTHDGNAEISGSLIVSGSVLYVRGDQQITGSLRASGSVILDRATAFDGKGEIDLMLGGNQGQVALTTDTNKSAFGGTAGIVADSGSKYVKIYGDLTHVIEVDAGNGLMALRAPGVGIEMYSGSGEITPATGNTYKLGSDSVKWKSVHSISYSGSSYTGSFVGDGRSLINVTASIVEYSNIANKPALLSGSSQIASEISGAFNSTSSSLATRLTTNESSINSLNSKTGSYAVTGSNNFNGDQHITGSLRVNNSNSSVLGKLSIGTTALQGDTPVDNIVFISGSPTQYVTYRFGTIEMGWNISGIDGYFGTLSSNDFVIQTNSTPRLYINQTNLTSSLHFIPTADNTLYIGTTQRRWNQIHAVEFSGSKFSGSFYGDGLNLLTAYSNITGKPTLLSGSSQIASDISGAFSSTSSSLASRLTTEETKVSYSGSFSGSFQGDGRLLTNLSGSAITNFVYRTFYVDAGGMVPRVTNGAGGATEEYSSNDIMSDHFLFDSASEEGVQFRVMMPDEWNLGTVKAKIYWDAASGSNPNDQVSWAIRAGAISDSQSIDSALGDSVVINDVLTARGNLQITPASNLITIGNSPQLADMVIFQIVRNVSGSDNMNVDAKLLGVSIQYGENSSSNSQW